MKLYLVIGHTGVYDDATEWPVVAYAHSASAHAHMRRAIRWTTAHGCDWHNLRGDRLRFSRAFTDSPILNPWDPEMQVDYTGVGYTVVQVPYLHRLPKGLPVWQ